MGYDFAITDYERVYLRELAKKYIEYANMPVMDERKKLWYAHNLLKGDRPPIIIETYGFESEILPAFRCETPEAREIERNLLLKIINYEKINDDKVISPYYSVYWNISCSEFDVEVGMRYVEDSTGKVLGYEMQHPIKDLKRDFELLKPSTFYLDKDYTTAMKSFVEDIIGDIMPVKIKNASLFWHVVPSIRAVRLMGLELLILYDR